MTTADDLRERVKGLSGPDRGVDKQIATVVLGIQWRPYAPRARTHWGYWPDGRTAFYDDVPHKYTGSIDTALALVERVLPGTEWSRPIPDNEDGVSISLWKRVRRNQHEHLGHGNAKTTPLAILAALLTTISASEATNAR